MDMDAEELKNFADDEETAVECIQIAPLGGERAAILFLLSDPDYETTVSVIFVVEDFEPASASIVLLSETWLMALSAAPSGELFALEATTSIWRWTGTDWSRTKVSETSLRTVWAEDRSGPIAVGTEGQAFRLRDQRWQAVTPLAPVQYLDVHGDPRHGIFACGDEGSLHRLVGSAWAPVDLHRNDRFQSVDIASDGTIRLAGDDGVCLRVANEEITELETSGLTHLSVRSFVDRRYWGDETGVYIEDGNALEFFADTGIASDLRVEGQYLYVAGIDTAWRFDGGAWRSLRLVYDNGFRLV